MEMRGCGEMGSKHLELRLEMGDHGVRGRSWVVGRGAFGLVRVGMKVVWYVDLGVRLLSCVGRAC